METTTNLASDIVKPSKFSLFWWRNYFCINPYTIYRERGLSYNAEGFLVYPPDRDESLRYWTKEGVTSQNCDLIAEQVGEAIGTFLFTPPLLILKFPFLVIILWIIVPIYSIATIDTSDLASFFCKDFQFYILFTSTVFLISLIFVVYGVFTLQNLYSNYFPGTPSVKIKRNDLLIFLRESRHCCLYLYRCFYIITAIGIIQHFRAREMFDFCPTNRSGFYLNVLTSYLSLFAFHALEQVMHKKFRWLKKGLNSNGRPTQEHVSVSPVSPSRLVNFFKGGHLPSYQELESQPPSDNN